MDKQFKSEELYEAGYKDGIQSHINSNDKSKV